MKSKLFTVLVIAPSLALASTAVASTWYVNGVSGSNSNNCMSPTTACKTIKHAISLASSGDTIMVAAATYTENLTIGFSLNVVGAGASTTIIDGRQVNTVVTISNGFAHVTLSGLTIRNGVATSTGRGGGIYNGGSLVINNSMVTGNFAGGSGGGIGSDGSLTINRTTISGNHAGGKYFPAFGGGIAAGQTLTINNSTVTGNFARGFFVVGSGGGISTANITTINNSTISGNGAFRGGGIWGTATIQNSIVANNSRGNCSGTMVSNGYNMSNDGTCNFHNSGDRNNTDPMLGPLQYNGGPTQTMALPSGSPAVDAGNPSGCTDGHGHLLKTDQRGFPRPDKEDSGGCDMGAYER